MQKPTATTGFQEEKYTFYRIEIIVKTGIILPDIV